jgi:hypothetical protein
MVYLAAGSLRCAGETRVDTGKAVIAAFIGLAIFALIPAIWEPGIFVPMFVGTALPLLVAACGIHILNTSTRVWPSSVVMFSERKDGGPFRDGRSILIHRDGWVLNMPGLRYYALPTGLDTIYLTLDYVTSKDDFRVMVEIIAAARIEFADADAASVLAEWKHRCLRPASNPKAAHMAALGIDEELVKVTRSVVVEAVRKVSARWNWREAIANRPRYSDEVSAGADELLSPLGLKAVVALKEMRDSVGYQYCLGFNKLSWEMAFNTILDRYAAVPGGLHADGERLSEPAEFLARLDAILRKYEAVLDRYERFTPESWPIVNAELEGLKQERDRLIQSAANSRFTEDDRAVFQDYKKARTRYNGNEESFAEYIRQLQALVKRYSTPKSQAPD